MSKILVIDDAPAARLTVQFMLEDDGHEVFVADGGLDGLQQFAAHDVDLVITDIMMPDITGVEVIKKIHEEHADFPILGITGGGTKEIAGDVINEAYEIADYILKKPFLQDELLESVNKLLVDRN